MEDFGQAAKLVLSKIILMIRQIIKDLYFKVLSILIIFTVLLVGWTGVVNALSNEVENNNPSVISVDPPTGNEPVNNKSELPLDETSIDELLGSEQVFPFEAGFGKNLRSD